jgi:hypothetical protein
MTVIYVVIGAVVIILILALIEMAIALSSPDGEETPEGFKHTR